LSTELFSAVRHPERRAPLLVPIAAWVVIYFLLATCAALAFSDGRTRDGWILVAIAALQQLLPYGVVVWKALPWTFCIGCGRRGIARRLRVVPTYFAEPNMYVLLGVCQACCPRMFDAMEADLFRFVDPAKRLEPFLRLLCDSGVPVPPMDDWREIRAWLKQFAHEVRAGHGGWR